MSCIRSADETLHASRKCLNSAAKAVTHFGGGGPGARQTDTLRWTDFSNVRTVPLNALKSGTAALLELLLQADMALVPI